LAFLVRTTTLPLDERVTVKVPRFLPTRATTISTDVPPLVVHTEARRVVLPDRLIFFGHGEQLAALAVTSGTGGGTGVGVGVGVGAGDLGVKTSAVASSSPL
jgi:hypothetical protein